MHRALYRKWRPQVFSDVCGQNQITDILQYEVANGKTSHAYLFCGSRGTGKTTCAKILAKAVNCLSPVNGNPCNACTACRAIDAGIATDVVEMDAASNTSVDNVRDIKEEIVYSPAELKCRVYIIDEVHMLSTSAFNALLKTLEEPPPHVMFILATTELQKLPTTVISRCQRFDFRRISSDVIVSRLMTIAAGENIGLTEDAARVIARAAQGGMRDAISLFELCAGLSDKIDAPLAVSTLGIDGRESLSACIRAVAEKDYPTIYETIRKIVMSSRDLSVFWQELIDYYRDMMIAKTTPAAKAYLDLTDGELSDLIENAKRFPMATLVYHSRCLEDAMYAMQRAGFSKRSTAELALTRMCDPRLSVSAEALAARIDKLERDVMTLRAGGSAPYTETTATDNRKDVPKKSGSDTPRETVVSEEKKPSPGDDGAVFRPFPHWNEVIENVARTRPQIVRFLETAKAYMRKNGDCLLRVKMGLGANILRREENLNLVRGICAEVAGDSVRSGTFTIETADTPSSGTVVDELLEALGDSGNP